MKKKKKKFAALTDVDMDFLHPRVDHRVLGGGRGGPAVGREVAGSPGRRRRRRRAGRHRVAAAAPQLRRGGCGEDVTPRGHHHHRGGGGGGGLLPARRVRRLAARRRRRRRVEVVQGVRLEGGRLWPRGAVVVRRVAGQIVAV